MKDINEILFDYEIDYFLNKIKNKDYFSYSRFNDGELICAMKQTPNGESFKTTKNCDNHTYYPQLGKELLESIKNSNGDNYIIQFMSGWLNNQNFINHINYLYENDYLKGKYQKGDFLQICLRYSPEKFKEMIRLFNENKVVIVGPDYLSDLKLLKDYTLIQVPRLNCYEEKNNILNRIKNVIDTYDMVLFASSMTTNVLIDELHKDYGRSKFLIDIGSLFDIFYYYKNKTIVQRSVNVSKLDFFQEVYKHYFQ